MTGTGIDFDNLKRQLDTDGATRRAHARVERALEKVATYHQLTNAQRVGTTSTEMPSELETLDTTVQVSLRSAQASAYRKVLPQLGQEQSRLVDDIARAWGSLNTAMAALAAFEAGRPSLAPYGAHAPDVAIVDGETTLADWLRRGRPPQPSTATGDDQRGILEKLGQLLTARDEEPVHVDV